MTGKKQGGSGKRSRGTAQRLAYRIQDRRTKNRLRKLQAHVRRHPEDEFAVRNLILISQNKPGNKGKRAYRWISKPGHSTDDTPKNVIPAPYMYRMKIA